jgi:hypothetical protein
MSLDQYLAIRNFFDTNRLSQGDFMALFKVKSLGEGSFFPHLRRIKDNTHTTDVNNSIVTLFKEVQDRDYLSNEVIRVRLRDVTRAIFVVKAGEAELPIAEPLP